MHYGGKEGQKEGCWVAGVRLMVEAPQSKDQDGEKRLEVLDKVHPEVTLGVTQLPGSGSLLETRWVGQRGWKASLKTQPHCGPVIAGLTWGLLKGHLQDVCRLWKCRLWGCVWWARLTQGLGRLGGEDRNGRCFKAGTGRGGPVNCS